MDQTLSFLTRRFQEAGIRPDTRHGQNFLIDVNLQHLILRTAQLTPDDVVLEVGTGTGALTAMLAKHAAVVISVEIDRHLYDMARDQLMGLTNVELLCQDVLKTKNRLDARVIETIQRHVDAAPGRQLKLVANLPFNVATPVLSNLLLGPVVPAMMAITIQKELADRIVAVPSTKDYGALSVWVQSQCQAAIVRVLPPTVFWPRPKVHSAIIHLQLDAERRSRIADPAYWNQFARAMFFHRRKFLRSVLLSAFKPRLTKPRVDELIDQLGRGPDCRTEQLDIPALLALCDILRAEFPDWHL